MPHPLPQGADVDAVLQVPGRVGAAEFVEESCGLCCDSRETAADYNLQPIAVSFCSGNSLDLRNCLPKRGQGLLITCFKLTSASLSCRGSSNPGSFSAISNEACAALPNLSSRPPSRCCYCSSPLFSGDNPLLSVREPLLAFARKATGKQRLFPISQPTSSGRNQTCASPSARRTG